MKQFWLALLALAFSTGAHAQADELWVNSVFQMRQVSPLEAVDYTVSYEKFEKCVDGYVKKQSHSYAKAAQSNLYDLVHNFDQVLSKLSNKKIDSKSTVTKEERILALAQIQCNTYHRMGLLE